MSTIRAKTVDSVLGLIGNTPMVRLNRMADSSMAEVWAKIEAFNPGGSIKDRIALSMVEDAERRGLLRPGATLVESTSGNTGIGLAIVAAVKGYRCVITMPEWMAQERLCTLRSFGVEVVITPAEQGMAGANKKAEEIAARTPGAFLCHQFCNPANPEIHRQTTAQEILKAMDGRIDAFVAGVGTGGTITGVGEVLKEHNPALRVIAVEPAASPLLSKGVAGIHRIQGIGANFIPEVLNCEVLDEVRTVGDEDAYHTARRLAREEGLLAGISAGAATYVSLQVAREMGPGRRVVAILPDTGERYFGLESLFGV
jgi:cysteine synthase A